MTGDRVGVKRTSLKRAAALIETASHALSNGSLSDLRLGRELGAIAKDMRRTADWPARAEPASVACTPAVLGVTVDSAGALVLDDVALVSLRFLARVADVIEQAAAADTSCAQPLWGVAADLRGLRPIVVSAAALADFGETAWRKSCNNAQSPLTEPVRKHLGAMALEVVVAFVALCGQA